MRSGTFSLQVECLSNCRQRVCFPAGKILILPKLLYHKIAEALSGGTKRKVNERDVSYRFIAGQF